MALRSSPRSSERCGSRSTPPLGERSAVPAMPVRGCPARRRVASSSKGRSPSPSTTRSKGPSSNINSGRKVASMPPATMSARGASRRARCASSRSNRNVMPVVEIPTTSHVSSFNSRSSACCGASVQQFGSNTRACTPAFCRVPARRQTPSGGARNVYSPQCGS